MTNIAATSRTLGEVPWIPLDVGRPLFVKFWHRYTTRAPSICFSPEGSRSTDAPIDSEVVSVALLSDGFRVWAELPTLQQVTAKLEVRTG